MQQGSRESVPSASSFTGTVGEDPTIPPRPPKWAFPAGCHRVASPREVRLCLPTLMLPPPRVPTPRQHARGQGGVTQGGRHRSPHAPLPRKCPHSNQGSPSLTWGLRATGPGGAPGERGERPWPPRTVPGGQQRRSCPAGGGFPVRAQRPDGKGHCLGQVCSLFTRRPRVPGQRPELDPHGPQATARGLSAFPKPPLRVSPCASCSEALPFTSSCCSEVRVSPPLSNF